MKKKKILIVEDEYISAMGLEEELHDRNYETCEIAGSGKDAIRIAERERPDIVLMDIGLPGKINGIEAAKKINCRLKIPVIFISGYSEKEVKQLDLCGPIHFIRKPVDFDELETVLAAL